MEMFFKAAKNKLRFGTSKGDLSTEDLFELSLNSLNSMAQSVNKQLREEDEESFLPTATRKIATNNNLRLEILKAVIAVKVQEQDDKKKRVDNAQQLAFFKNLAETKTMEKLSAQSLEDIQKKIAELEGAGV